MKRLLLILTGVTAANLLAKPISPRQALATASSFFPPRASWQKATVTYRSFIQVLMSLKRG